MYHYVRDSAATAHPRIRALAPDLFEQQLEWLQSHYNVIGVPELEAALDGRARLPARAALLTFDDGFVDHYETVFPALRRRGLSGVFFLSQSACGPERRLLGVHKTHFLLATLGAEAFGRAVLAECELSHGYQKSSRNVLGLDTWEEADDRAIKQLLNYELPAAEADRVLETLFARHVGDASVFARELYLDERMVHAMAAGGMVFGYHTRSHRMLSRLEPQQQDEELREGVGWIRRLTGQATVPFCYPWGGPQTYTRDTVRLLGEAGYSLAFNTSRRRAAIGVDGRSSCRDSTRVTCRRTPSANRRLPPRQRATKHDAVERRRRGIPGLPGRA
jgi:peptidoglycan/xylan/chitin deacetylase (PgdA/CDA1 family)